MKAIRFYLPPFLWMIAIFIASSQQRLQVSPIFIINFAFFKTLHILEYGILYILFYRALINTTSLSKEKTALVSLLLSIFYAATDELHQTFVPTREGKISDIGFDTIGIMLAWYFLWRLLPLLPARLKKLAKDWQLV